jgi:hypothetical protein
MVISIPMFLAVTNGRKRSECSALYKCGRKFAKDFSSEHARVSQPKWRSQSRVAGKFSPSAASHLLFTK